MKNKPKIFFTPLRGQLHCLSTGFLDRMGDAHVSKECNGVYFTSPNGELIAVQFDDVDSKQDQQTLTTKAGDRVNVSVKSGKVTIKVSRAPKKVV